MLYHIMMNIRVWTRGFFVVVWGVKFTPENYFDIQKIQIILELKYRQLKKRLNDLFYFILEIGLKK